VRKPFGPQLPAARRYVLEFGTCVLSFIYLEQYLQQYLFNRRALASEWPLKQKKLDKVLESLERVQLPDLTKDFAKQERAPRLLALLTSLNTKRNTLMHNVLPIHDLRTLHFMLDELISHRKRVRRITASVHNAMRAVIKRDDALFAQIEARNQVEPIGKREDFVAIVALFNRRTARVLSALDP
jgi:hypothetical protein